jgi:hypothetical protein
VLLICLDLFCLFMGEPKSHCPSLPALLPLPPAPSLGLCASPSSARGPARGCAAQRCQLLVPAAFSRRL